MPEEKKPETSCNCSGKDIEESKAMAAISYLGILFLIPLLAKKDSPFAQFHAKQGLALFVLEVIYGFATAIPFIGWFLISWVVGIFIIVLFIMGLVNALGGKCIELPLIGGWFKTIKV